MIVPFSGLKREYSEIQSEVDDAVRRVLSSGWFVLGDELIQFEAECSTYLGIKHVVGVASGTEAIALALLAYNIGAGDEVITTDVTAFPTVSAILMTGARPVFVDVDPMTGLLDTDKLEEAFTSRTKAVIPVHLYGQCVPMELVKEFAVKRGLVVLEDCAQAFGALHKGRPAGTFGDIAAFSFYPTKNLGAAGDGGAIATDRDDMNIRLRQMRNYGQSDRYHHDSFGINSRLDEIQAAILRTKLRHLDVWNARRRDIARHYIHNLNPEVARPMGSYEGNDSNFHLFVVRVTNRDRFRAYLSENGIETLIHYPIPCSRQGALPGSLKRTTGNWASDEFTREVVSLPLYPQLDEDTIHDIVSLVNGYPHE